jgi:outer membrane lipoprotein carrier protein
MTMQRRGLALLMCAAFPAWAQTDILRLLRGVEERYNRPRTVQIRFEQTLQGYGGAPRRETGTLYLLRPGRMRWDYERPKGKFFLVDGKNVYFYSPTIQRVEKSPLKESDDMRAPLAFLIGRLDFQRYFREFRSRPEGSNIYIVAKPKSERAPYAAVEFAVTADYRIAALKVIGQDESVMEFAFSAEVINPRLDERLFTFRPPPDVEVVEVEAQ